MRSIQFAKHLCQHIAEVILVVDIWQELLVCLLVCGPVNTMQVFAVELVVDLTPDVLEQVLAFLIRTIVEWSLEVDICTFALGNLNLLYTASAHNKKVLTLLVGHKVSSADIFQHQLVLVLSRSYFHRSYPSS